jgi:hypothetical protein
MDTLLFMKCLRCRGAMIYDKFYGLQEQFWGWKCLICGEIVDPVILENRQLMRAGQGINVRRPRRLNRNGQDFRSRKIRNALLSPLQERRQITQAH